MKMSECNDDPDPLPLSLVVAKKDYLVPTLSKLEPEFEPRKRLKLNDDRVRLEGRAEEILVEIEPDIEVDDEPTQSEDRQKSDQDNYDEDLSEMDDNSTDQNLSDTFHIDELSLTICHEQNEEICLNCPFCSISINLSDVGKHFQCVHKLSRFICPGSKCPNRIKNVNNYQEHVIKHHFDLTCPQCNLLVQVSQYQQHLSSHDNSPPSPHQQCDKNIKPTILQPRNCNSTPEKPVLIKPKPLEQLLGYGVTDNFEILLDGKLVVVDGLYFYIRNGVVFLDCVHCSKAMSLSLYGSHIMDNHFRETVDCRAVNCQRAISAETIQEHIQSQHTRVRCKVCTTKLELLQIGHHDREACEKLCKSLTKPVLNPVHSTGIHFLSHFLDDRSLVQITPKSSCDEREFINKDEDNNTTTSCCSSVSSNGTSQNNNTIENNLSRKKQKTSKNDRNGKIPTVPCPYCGKQCSYLNKHIRDVHQPKVHCPVCGKRMGKSYLSEHMKIQHQGKEVPTKVCPLCGTRVQKLKNHLKYSHKMSREESDEVYAKFYPNSELPIN